ncbi:hypothetical protein LZ31DRAFT_255492 [Colletotrichum somersetense]|nr:hypothetical protein LZ31DRAFT_255492 [Colletotrichum somersetense]
MSSVFGMNNKDIGDTNMSFREQAVYMCMYSTAVYHKRSLTNVISVSISVSVIVVSFIFAFWTYPRTVVWSAYKYSETWFLVTFRIYDMFIRLKKWKKDLMTSDGLLKSLEKSVDKMRSKVTSRLVKSAAGSSENNQNNSLSDDIVTGNAVGYSKSVSSTDERMKSSGTNNQRIDSERGRSRQREGLT